MKYTDIQRVKKMLEYGMRLNKCIEEMHITKEMLLKDVTLQWMVTTPLYNIGEQAYQLSSDFKEKHSEIQWSMISGLRHRLVHDYDGTNWSIIADVVLQELPELCDMLSKM